MSTHDYVIDNALTPTFRSDLNSALVAIVSNNSSTSAPTITYANMWWYDTTNDTLKIRNEANSGWISLGTVDQTNSKFNPNFLPATQAEAEAGTNNVKGMTPLRVAQEITAQVGVANATSVKTAINASGSAPIYACRAWVNFNGTGTVAIRASGNVSSITDNGTGLYTINFATALPNANYCPVVSCATNNVGTAVQVHSTSFFSQASVKTTTELQVSGRSDSGNAFDVTEFYVSIFC